MTETEYQDRRKRIEDLVLGVIQRMDNDKMYNYNRYKALFASMDRKQFEVWAGSMGHAFDDAPTIYQLPFEEVRMPQIKSAADFLGIPLEEYVWYNHVGDEPIRTKTKVPVGYITIKRTQQLLSKKNKYAIDNEKRSLKTGQVIADSKTASITTEDSFFMSAIGADNALKEFLGPRADHFNQKQEMYHQIAVDGYTALSDLTDDNNKSSTALNTINTYMLASGLWSDLITDTLKTAYTIENDLRNK